MNIVNEIFDGMWSATKVYWKVIIIILTLMIIVSSCASVFSKNNKHTGLKVTVITNNSVTNDYKIIGREEE